MNAIQSLIMKYFPQAQWQNAYRVMMAESNGNPNAANDKVPTRERSYGLFQINTNVHKLTPAEARDPETNVKYAAALYKAQGWQPWTTAQQMGLVGNTGMTYGTIQPGPSQGGRDLAKPPRVGDVGSVNAGQGPTQNAPMLTRVMDAKGGYVSVALNQKTDQFGAPVAPQEGRETYRYTWADGTYLDVTGSPTSNGYIEEGTALKALDEKATTAASAAPDTIKFPDGSLHQWNPSTKQWDLLQDASADTTTQPKYQTSGGNTSDRYIQTFDPTTGSTKWDPNPNYTPDTAAQPKFQTGGAGANQKQIQTFDPTTGQSSWQDNPNYVDPTLGQSQIANYWATMTDIENGLRSGQMDAATGNKLMDMARTSLEAEMRGTTAFQQEQAKISDERNRQQLAGTMIGQRLSSANSLASSLTSSAFGLAQNTMMPAGKTSMGLNPMAWAADYSNKQGGDQLSALAQQLLSGASGGAPVGTGPQTEEDYQKMLAGLSGQGAK